MWNLDRAGFQSPYITGQRVPVLDMGIKQGWAHVSHSTPGRQYSRGCIHKERLHGDRAAMQGPDSEVCSKAHGSMLVFPNSLLLSEMSPAATLLSVDDFVTWT